MSTSADTARAHALLAPCFARLGIARPMERMVDAVYLPIAQWIADRRARVGRTVVIGVQGAQGSGKSTLAEAVRVLLEELFGFRVAVLSLDDLYLTRAEREALASTVHSLFRTRGAPGTHDVALGHRVLDALAHASTGDEARIPRFDKGTDDRAPEASCPLWTGPCDVVVFEGWCVGVPPEDPAALVSPANRLEAEEDADGKWRRHANDQLGGPYAALWARLDGLIALGVPSMAEVLAWRTRQEHALAAARGSTAVAVMSDAEIARFVEHFERITRHALHVMPDRADVWVRLGVDQLPVEVRLGRAGTSG